MKNLLPQFSRYARVSVVAAIVQYSLLTAGVALGLGVLPSSTLALIAAAATGYALNRAYTYGSQGAHTSTVPRFVLVVLVGLAINALCMQWLHHHLGLHYLLAQVLSTSITMLWSFAAHRHWTFALPEEGVDPDPAGSP